MRRLNVGVSFISDREDMYLPDCKRTFDEYVRTVDGHVFPQMVIDDRDHRLGLAGAARAAWDWAREWDLDFLFHVEEDFLFHTEIDLGSMAFLLDTHPRLAQVCLKRQADPRSPEAAVGGIIEQHPYDYTDRETDGIPWVEHRRCFSLNPCLIPRRTYLRGWPDGNEAQFTAEAVADGLTFAFFGGRHDAPRVEHQGWERSAGWRL